MKRLLSAAALAAGLAGTSAFAADFQTIGTMGMGGAGVARNMGAYAPYWNPAGLAFAPKSFTTTIGAGVGLRVSDGLADNLDKLSKLDGLTRFSTTGPNPNVLGDSVLMTNVIEDIYKQEGVVAFNVDVAAGFQIGRIGFGVFGLSEGYGKTVGAADLANILPGTYLPKVSITPTDLPILAGTGNPAQSFFNPTQVASISTSLTSLGVAAGSQTEVINALGNSLVNSGLSPQQAADTFNGHITNALTASAGNSTLRNINDNTSAVMLKDVLFTEIPISYGHPIDMGTMGRLGLGATVKLVNARVYQTRFKIIDNGNTLSASDIYDEMRNNSYEESTNVTLDLGTQWKYADWLTVGVIGKNLTSPTFKSPEVKDQTGSYVDVNGIREGATGFAGRYHEGDIKLKPQARAGIEIKALSWLSLSADIDLTENESSLEGLKYKNRQLGGGAEFSPADWFKLRAGMYKNLANSALGNVATAGLTFGIPWVTLEIDGAYGLQTTQYDGKEYPKESRVQAQLTMQF